MTYHFDTIAFKKTEILKVLQDIDPNFDLGYVNREEKEELVESVRYEDKTNFNDYRKFLFKMPLLSLWEAASIISGVDPADIENLEEYDARSQYPNLSSAVSFLNASEEAGLITFHNFKITKQELQLFLTSQDILIEGYNQLLTDLNVDLKQLDLQQKYDYLLNKINDLNIELAQAKECIKQYEYQKSDTNNLLELIFDESAKDKYAPDLAYAIRLWQSVYIDNNKADSHNSKANTWIKNNTPYSGEQDDTATRRLREIASSYNDWHSSRKKLLENK